MSKNLVIILVIIVLLVVGGVVLFSMINKPSNPTVTPSAEPITDISSSPTTTQEVVFTITSSGVSPSSVTIKAGDSVTWVNQASVDLQISSDPHPQHTEYPALNTVGMLPAGAKKSLNFPDKGTYKWHDHLNPSLRGTVVVVD